MRRLSLVLTVVAMMAVLLMMSAAPALADHRHHHDRFDHVFFNEFNDDDEFEFLDFDDDDEFDEEDAELQSCDFAGFDAHGHILVLCEVDFDFD